MNSKVASAIKTGAILLAAMRAPAPYRASGLVLRLNASVGAPQQHVRSRSPAGIGGSTSMTRF
jgi:hypothetical protein